MRIGRSAGRIGAADSRANDIKTLAIRLDLCDNCLRKHRVLMMYEHGDEEDSHAGAVFSNWNSVI